MVTDPSKFIKVELEYTDTPTLFGEGKKGGGKVASSPSGRYLFIDNGEPSLGPSEGPKDMSLFLRNVIQELQKDPNYRYGNIITSDFNCFDRILEPKNMYSSYSRLLSKRFFNNNSFLIVDNVELTPQQINVIYKELQTKDMIFINYIKVDPMTNPRKSFIFTQEFLDLYDHIFIKCPKNECIDHFPELLNNSVKDYSYTTGDTFRTLQLKNIYTCAINEYYYRKIFKTQCNAFKISINK